jgi:hypothetical protein
VNLTQIINFFKFNMNLLNQSENHNDSHYVVLYFCCHKYDSKNGFLLEVAESDPTREIRPICSNLNPIRIRSEPDPIQFFKKVKLT